MFSYIKSNSSEEAFWFEKNEYFRNAFSLQQLPK
jgi:hypothetical protein